MKGLRGDWLVAFVAVIEAGSFTGAAKRMHRTQSAVSMQIQQLEYAAGTTLLARERGGVIPTAAGNGSCPMLDVLPRRFMMLSPYSRLPSWRRGP